MKTCELRRAAGALATAAWISSWAVGARGQAQDQAAARALFENGRELMKAGQYATACPKFEAASKLFAGAGILLNLGDCYEKLGRTASAWTEFGEAVSVARRTNRPNEIAEASRRQAALDTLLVRLVIRVSHPVPGLVIKRDGLVIAAAAWGAAIPVDPGTHEVRTEADGYESWSASVQLAAPGQTETVDVPAMRPKPSAGLGAAALDREPSRQAADTGGAAASDGVSPSGVPAWLLLGGGVALGVGGGAFMFIESQRASDARAHHDVAAYDSLQTPWTIGLVGAIAGGACVAGGVVLMVTSAGRHSATATTSPSLWLDARPGEVLLRGVF